MNNPLNTPAPDTGAINESVRKAVHSHRVKLRVLTTTAFVFGLLAIAASIYMASFWMMSLPKQNEILKDFPNPKAAELATSNPESTEVGLKRIERVVREEAFMTHLAITVATGVALAVVALGLGTLILLTVVVLNRRVALKQINDSLTQISNQLRELPTVRGGP